MRLYALWCVATCLLSALKSPITLKRGYIQINQMECVHNVIKATSGSNEHTKILYWSFSSFCYRFEIFYSWLKMCPWILPKFQWHPNTSFVVLLLSFCNDIRICFIIYHISNPNIEIRDWCSTNHRCRKQRTLAIMISKDGFFKRTRWRKLHLD